MLNNRFAYIFVYIFAYIFEYYLLLIFDKQEDHRVGKNQLGNSEHQQAEKS